MMFFMQFIPKEERVITVEDSLELHYGDINPAHDYVELQVSENFDYRKAIKASLRQDADWLVLSEARSSEVEALLEEWSTGISGFTTIHLDDLRKLPDRIGNMMDNKEAAERIEDRVYSDVDCREDGKNSLCFFLDNKEKKSEKLPAEVMQKFKRAGIADPFYCEKMEEYRRCGK